ncbi:MAG: hypothetical protein AABY93_10725 [Bacteroidota bacterium]
MREFSEYEKKVINEKLIKGSDFSGLLSDDLYKKSKVIIRINFNGSGKHKIEYRSDSYDAQLAIDEIVDLYHLLNFLLETKLIRKYPPAANTNRDHKTSPTISLGISESREIKNFSLESGSSNLGEFIMQHENYKFKATEPLRFFAANNFESSEDRKHRDNLKHIRKQLNVTLIVAIAGFIITGFIGYVQYKKSYDELFYENGIMRSKIEVLETKLRNDSLNHTVINQRTMKLKRELDSTKTSIQNQIELIRKKVKAK